MSSRATAPVAPPKGKTTVDRFQAMDQRVAVCTRCHYAMPDVESCFREGEFHHIAPKALKRAFACPNQNKRFGIFDLEIMPFMRKGERRRVKRLSKRV